MLLLTSHPLASHIATPIGSPPGGEVGLFNAHTSIVNNSEAPKQYIQDKEPGIFLLKKGGLAH